MTGPFACSSTPAPEIAVRPRCDVVAEGQSVHEFEEDIVRPKCDMDAEELNDDEIAERRSPPQVRH